MSSGTAIERLQRLLAAIPLFAEDDTLTRAELAERLGGSCDAVMHDLQSLPERYDAPGGFVDPIQVEIENAQVSVRSSHFLRPTRINVPELCALELGLAMLAAQTPPDELAIIERARLRIRDAIVTVPGGDGDAIAGEPPTGGDTEAVRSLREAIASHHKARLVYRGGADTESSERVVHPYALSPRRGTWFLAAHCERSNGLRVFRADRLESVTALDEPFEQPPSIDVESLFDTKRPLVLPLAHPTMTVRYSPAIARWIAEREEKPLAADGSATIEHPLVDMAWAVRHVLQYGAEAEVLAPREVRDEVRRALTAMSTEIA